MLAYDRDRISWFYPVTLPPPDFFPKGPPVTFSIVITNYGYEDYLPAVLRSIVSQHYPPSCYEVIVVDDNSVSKERAYATMFLLKNLYPEVQLSFYETHRNVTFNIAKAFNIGLRKAKYDFVLNLPADCRLLRSWHRFCPGARTDQQAMVAR